MRNRCNEQKARGTHRLIAVNCAAHRRRFFAQRRRRSQTRVARRVVARPLPMNTKRHAQRQKVGPTAPTGPFGLETTGERRFDCRSRDRWGRSFCCWFGSDRARHTRPISCRRPQRTRRHCVKTSACQRLEMSCRDQRPLSYVRASMAGDDKSPPRACLEITWSTERSEYHRAHSQRR